MTIESKSRLILGDCIDVLKRIPDESIDLVVTDPPYLVNFTDRGGRKIIGDINSHWLYPAFKEITRVLKNNACVISFYGWNKVHHFMRVWVGLGLRPVGHFVCTKKYASSRGLTARTHENAYLLAKGKPSFTSTSIPHDVLPMPYTGNKLHPTQKPVEVLRTFIEAYSEPGALILDPFAGSASTAIAAKSLERECIAIEKDPQYFALAKDRLLARAA